MKYYYEIRPESEAYKDIMHQYLAEEKWNSKEIIKQICSLLKVESVNKNLILDPNTLTMSSPPEHLRDQFKKKLSRCGNYLARVNSEINKAWINLCKEHGLISPSIYGIISFKWGLWGTGNKQLARLEDRFFIIAEKAINRDFLNEVSEKDYLQIRIEFLNRQEKEKLELTTS